MTLQEMLKDEHRAGVALGLEKGRAEGQAKILKQTKDELIKTLSKLGEVSDVVNEKLAQENEQNVLMDWFRIAITSKTIEEFEEKIK